MWVDYWMHLSHTLTGPGLFALLAFSRVSHLNSYLVGVIAVCWVLGTVLARLYPAYDICTRLPKRHQSRSLLFSYLINISFNLLITIAVLLNVVSQIYPEQGREIALIPVYVMLCCSRLCPSEITFTIQGLTTSVFVLAMYLFVHSEKHARPDSEVTFDWTVIIDVVLTQIYASIQQHTGVFYVSREWDWLQWAWYSSNSTWYLNSSWLSVIGANLIRSVFFSILLLTQHAVVYHFLIPKSDPVQHYALVCYGSLLILGCMLLGSSWFCCLRDMVTEVSGRPITEKRIVRLQHVLYALVVAGAYIFPLQMVELRIVLVSLLLALSLL